MVFQQVTELIDEFIPLIFGLTMLVIIYSIHKLDQSADFDISESESSGFESIPMLSEIDDILQLDQSLSGDAVAKARMNNSEFLLEKSNQKDGMLQMP